MDPLLVKSLCRADGRSFELYFFKVSLELELSFCADGPSLAEKNKNEIFFPG